MTDCSTCNKLDVICDKNINDLVAANGLIVLLEMNTGLIYSKAVITGSTAFLLHKLWKIFNNGAYIVDVRSYEDYSQLRIRAALHPLDKLEVELERLIPDRSSKIIFYCAKE